MLSNKHLINENQIFRYIYIYILRHHKIHDISIHSFGGNYLFTKSKTHMLSFGNHFFSEQDDFVLKK